MTGDDDVSALLEGIERRGWDALSNGSGSDFYGERMRPDGLMILAGGFALDREGVVDSLRVAPPWDAYQLDDVRCVRLAPDAAALMYRATARRGDSAFSARMTSLYVRGGGEWRLVHYQQTPIEAASAA